tara:strand:+ start:531 stop:953 length:423 start_codon:yes stop_codon:yes gene_type:complete
MSISLHFEKGRGAHFISALCLTHEERADELKHLLGSSEGIRVEVVADKKDRSRSQENYYRKWSRAFGSHCGLMPDEIHDELLCLAFGSTEVETKFGIRRRPSQRSADCTSSTYAELIEVLIRVSAEMGFRVPPPYEQDNY